MPSITHFDNTMPAIMVKINKAEKSFVEKRITTSGNILRNLKKCMRYFAYKNYFGTKLFSKGVKIMDKNELLQNYVNAIYQNINAGLQAIEDILPKIQDDNLKNLVAEMQDKYYSLSKECEVFAKSEDIKGIKDNNWLEKVKMWMGVNMSTLTDKSNRKISELLILGSFMGYITCIKDAADHKNISNELDEILEKLKNFQKSNIENLIPYLS